MAEPRIRLVTRGDDSGMCHSANVAVREAFQKGILRNTSLMVPCPGFEEAVGMLAGLDGLCIGLHADVTAEWDRVKWGPVLPVEQVPSLVDEDGHFFPTTQVLHERGVDVEEIKAEIKAQLDLARSRGVNIEYVDTHMGFGWLGDLDEWKRDFARREGLLRQWDIPGLPRAEGEFDNMVDAFIARLDAAPPGTYLTVGHPGYDAEDMRRFGHGSDTTDRVALERDWQRRMFMDRKVLDYCAANGVEPVRYSDVCSK